MKAEGRTPSLWAALSAEYHREPNVGHGTGRNLAGARACYECRRIEALVLRVSAPARGQS